MRIATTTTLLLGLTLTAATVGAQAPAHGPVQPPAPAAASSHTIATQDIKWGPAPAIFPPGAQMAVMQGDPGSTSLFTVRLRFPDGYRIAPHTHPTDEHVTVISGTFIVGMGSKVETKGTLTLGAGGFVTAPANHAHYAAAQGATIVQVHAMGPFAMTYVNPADTPKAVSSR